MFNPFAKPSQDLEKCHQWIVGCSHKFFTEKNISRITYICALHWPGESGLTEEFPDPLKANLTPEQASRASVKRKVPAERARPVTKAAKKTVVTDEQIETDGLDAFQSDDEVKLKKQRVYECPVSGKKVVDQETQTVYSKYVLSAKVKTMILNEMSTSQDCKPKIVSGLSYDYISQDCDLMMHFVGLTPKQFEVLYGFLNDICPLEKIHYWNFKESADSEKSTEGPESEFSCREKLFITLVRLR